jgi:hypothetical protein
VQTVCAPVATFVTVSTVPNGRVGLAHRPGAAAAYQVASPFSLSAVEASAGAGAVVVVVTLGTSADSV